MSTLKKEIDIIEQSFAQALKTCTSPWVLNYDEPLPGTPLTLHHLLMILGGTAGVINLSIAAYLFCGHLWNWTNPQEQKQCARIILFVPVVSLTSFFSIVFYNASGFINPVGQFYEGFAIIGLFLLYVQFVTPDESNRDGFYDSLEHKWMTGRPGRNQGSLSWFRRSWIMVFQLALTRAVTVIANEAIFGASCPLSETRSYGYIVVTSVQSTCTGIAVSGIVFYETRLRQHMKEHQSFMKFISFKGIVIVQALQEWIFSILAETKVFFPTPPHYYISYNDFSKGLPNLLLLWELTIVAVLFLWSFSFSRYHQQVRDGSPRVANPLRALASVFSRRDIGNGIVYMFKCFGAMRSDQPKNGTFATFGEKHESTPSENHESDVPKTVSGSEGERQA